MGTGHESVPGWIPGGGVDPVEPPATPEQGAPAQPIMPGDTLAGSGSAPPGTSPVSWAPPPPTPPPPLTTPTGGIPGWGTTGPASGQGGAPRSNGCVVAGVVIALVLALFATFAIVGLIFLGGQMSAILPTVRTELSSPLPDARRPSGGMVNIGDVMTGDCFNPPELGADRTVRQINLRPCTTAHILEVVAVVTLPDAADASFPGDTRIEQEAQTRCDAAFTSYLGVAQNASVYVTQWYAVSESGWGVGDRAIDCLAASADGTPIVGSVRDVRR